MDIAGRRVVDEAFYFRALDCTANGCATPCANYPGADVYGHAYGPVLPIAHPEPVWEWSNVYMADGSRHKTCWVRQTRTMFYGDFEKVSPEGSR